MFGYKLSGVNEAIQKQLSKITDTDLHQWASAIVGAAASSVVGGNAQAGASTAASGTKNNWLNHEQQEEFARKLAAAESEEERQSVIAYFTALSQTNAANDPSGSEAIEPEVLYGPLDGLLVDQSKGLNYNLTLLSSYSGLDGLVANYRDSLQPSSVYTFLSNEKNQDALIFATTAIDPLFTASLKITSELPAIAEEANVVI